MEHLAPKHPSPEVMERIKRLKIIPEEGKVIGPSGKDIGCPDVHGHIVCTVYIRSVPYKIRKSHLIWWGHHKEWPKTLIDHRDRVKDNDKIDNLRCRTHLQNMTNKESPNGLLNGVRKSDQGFEAFVKSVYVGISLGHFETQEEANDGFAEVRVKIAEAIKDVCQTFGASPISDQDRKSQEA